MISLHLPVLCPFGITPKRLICSGGKDCVSLNGPNILPSEISFWMYSVMMCGCCLAESMLAAADFSGDPCWNPILKPRCMPSHMYLAKVWSGWTAKARAQASGTSGVEMALNWFVVCALAGR